MSTGTGQTRATTATRVLSARILFVLGDRVLLASRRGEECYYLPGGNVEPGEGIEAALQRELREDVGIIPRSLDFVGTVEHNYAAGGKSWHEVNVVFAANVPRYAELGSRSDDVDISSVSVHALGTGTLKFQPPRLATAIKGWLVTPRPFHISAI